MKENRLEILEKLKCGKITTEQADKDLSILYFNSFKLPKDKIKKYCDDIEIQEKKFISSSKMVWYKLGIETGLNAFRSLLKYHIKDTENLK